MRFTLIAVIMNVITFAQANAATPTVAQTAQRPASPFQCNDLRKAAQKVEVYASNVANANTTRTPEGGPYKRIEIICKEMFCQTAAKEDFKLVYDRSHPDANVSGYVRYPNIDIATEYAALNAAAAEVRLLATTGVCGASALSSGGMALVKYDVGASITSDVFNFNADGKLTSWSRTLREGTSKSIAFNVDGTLTKSPDVINTTTK